MDFNYSEKSLNLQKKLNKFFEEHIYPIEQAYDQEIEDSGNSLHIPDILDELKDKAKKLDYGIYFYQTMIMVLVLQMLNMHL